MHCKLDVFTDFEWISTGSALWDDIEHIIEENSPQDLDFSPAVNMYTYCTPQYYLEVDSASVYGPYTGA